MKKQILFFILFPFILFGQIQVGSDIDGEAANDQSGDSISLSADGSIVAIGADFNDGNGTSSGHVRVYKNILGVWTQIGQDIDGEAANDVSGSSVSLSSDGSIIAIGANFNDGSNLDTGHVRVYENILGVWTQIGQDIDGEANFDRSGSSVSLSSDGSILAIGAPRNDGNSVDTGHVRVYEYQTNTWVQLGADIDGEAFNDQSGNSISLSSNGSIVAIGAEYNDGNGTDSGHVRVYEYQTNNWVQLGSDIDGEANFDRSGLSVSLSSNGSIVAIGAPLSNSNGTHSGRVRLYEYQTNNWVQLGSDIIGVAANDWLGSSVSLSSDGSIVAIGAWLYNGIFTEFGQVRLYEYQTDNWVQLGSDIIGEVVDDGTGYSVSLSSNGSIVAIGAPRNNGNGADSGHVRVYDLSGVLSSNSFVLSQFSIYPNPAKEKFTIQLSPDLELQKVNIYNSLGQFISSTTKNSVNTVNLSHGFYFIEIETNKGKATKKIIIE